jgi:hypothetical protein
MNKQRSPRRPAVATASGFRDPAQAARALCEAVLAITAVHGSDGDLAVLAPALQQLARTAAQRGLDVDALLGAAPMSALPRSGQRVPAAGSLNERLFEAVADAAQALLAVCHNEMDSAAVNEELYRTVLSAEMFERASATPRDPERCLTAALPRDLVLDLMYGLAWQRQCAEEVFSRHAPAELCSDARDELHRAAVLLREAGCTADVDAAMGLGIALWRPSAAGSEPAVHGIALSFGRSLLGREVRDYVLRFDAAEEGAASLAARILYRAHLEQLGRAAGETLELDGRVLRQQVLAKPQWHGLLGEIGVETGALDGCVRRIATLDICPQATEQAWRRKLSPAAAPASRAVHPATTTRH